MAAITIEEMRQKLAAYCFAYPEYKLEEANGKFLINKEGSKPITISVDGGKPKSSDPDFLLAVIDFHAGMGPVPAIQEGEATKIMGLMSQLPGYMPEISVEMIANLVHCPNAAAQDLIMLAVTAKNVGANPFLPGEIFLIKPKQRDDGSQPPAYTVIGQTLVAKKLSNAPGFSKAIRGIIVESKESVISYKSGNYYNPKREELTGAWAEIHYDDGRVVRKEMPIHELFGPNPSPQQKKQPGLMAAKQVFMMAAREAEPGLMGGCYDIDEMSGKIQIDSTKEIQQGA